MSRLRCVVPNQIVSMECKECGAPMVMAWREVAGRHRTMRMNVEVLVSCDCASEEYQGPMFVEPEL